MPEYMFPCGCRFPILEESPDKDVLPLLDFDIEKIPEDCPAVWDMLGKGLTKGVFQLETSHGKKWTKKLKPESTEHLSALGAILRPGVANSVAEDGVSSTDHYCRKKNGEEKLATINPQMDAIMSPTYGEMIYQEQMIALCVCVSAFDEKEADMARKAVGKKLPEEMAKIKKMFLDGAKKAGLLNDEQSEELWNRIEKSQKYLFNHSHSICYGLIGYDSAYIKAHFPISFFASWLLNARHKKSQKGPQQEIYELINDTRLFNVVVEPPDLRTLEPYFHTDRRVVKFGLCNIKGIGESQIPKIAEAAKALTKPIGECSWWEVLTQFSDNISASVMIRFIEVGACRWVGMQRQAMLAEFKVWAALTEKERNWIQGQKGLTAMIPALRAAARPKKEGGACANKNRVQVLESQILLLEHPPVPLVDSSTWIAYVEEELLGISLSCSKIDSCDISQVNCTCKEFQAGRTGYMMLGVEVQECREVKTRKGKTPGKKMGRLVLSDGTCSVEAVCFPEEWKEYSYYLSEGNTVIVQGEREKSKEYDSLIVKKVWQAK